jgi:hypothetical protein
MKLEIKGQIGNIQSEFNQAYPYLKIEFFQGEHQTNMLSSKMDMISGENLVGKFVKINNPGEIDIGGGRTVAQVERDFADKFGLSAQVFRKSGGLWIETSKSDDWTLDRQNEEGSLSCRENSTKTFEEKLEEDRWDLE